MHRKVAAAPRQRIGNRRQRATHAELDRRAVRDDFRDVRRDRDREVGNRVRAQLDGRGVAVDDVVRGVDAQRLGRDTRQRVVELERTKARAIPGGTHDVGDQARRGMPLIDGAPLQEDPVDAHRSVENRVEDPGHPPGKELRSVLRDRLARFRPGHGRDQAQRGPARVGELLGAA
jgi:hypothetical protein